MNRKERLTEKESVMAELKAMNDLLFSMEERYKPDTYHRKKLFDVRGAVRDAYNVFYDNTRESIERSLNETKR